MGETCQCPGRNVPEVLGCAHGGGECDFPPTIHDHDGWGHLCFTCIGVLIPAGRIRELETRIKDAITASETGKCNDAIQTMLDILDPG